MAKKLQDNKALSQDMIDNIKNYKNQIISLKDYITAVRKNPGMYIGSVGNKGLINLIREILQNGLDEVNKSDSPATAVGITFDERTQMTIVEDDGRGIPFGEIERIFAKQHTSSNYEKKPFQYSSGLHGVGSKVTNALSGRFIVESFVLGEARRFEFIEGYPWDKGEEPIPNKGNKQGSRITFFPSKEALGDTSITVNDVFALVNLILPLCIIGAKVVFNGIDSKGNQITEKLVNEDGIMTYIIDNVKSPLVKPIHLFRDNGTTRGDIMFTYDTNIGEPGNVSDPAKMFAFCNTCPTTMGTHIDGFTEGICYWFTNYMNKIYLAKAADTVSKNKKKQKTNTVTVKFDDVKFGMVSVISAAHLYPIFDGQSKEKLSNEDMKPFIKSLVMDELDSWAKSNPTDLNKICKYLKDVAEMRTKTDKEKINMTKKYSASALNGLPSNFVAPHGDWKKLPFEFAIAEGESAGGAMRNSIDHSFQGYLPIRGKIPDAFTKSRADFLGNQEVAGIAAIILDGIRKDVYDINNLGKKPIPVDKIKWDKILFGTDADSDGEHIDALLLRYFVSYMPELIIAGKVYKLLPPLYGLPIPGKATGKYKKHKMKYFLDRMEYTEFVQKNFTSTFKVTTHTGATIKPSELSKLFYNNAEYVYELEPIAANHSIPPRLLEDILVLRNDPIKQFTNKLKSKYRFITITESGNTKIISGSVDGAIRTVFVNNILIKECQKIIDILDINESYVYKVNGELVSLYQLMNLFRSSEPKEIQRYKGLGEMNGPKLFDSTLDPNTRTLIRYTMDSAIETIDRMRYYNNNMRELLNDIKVTRFDVMD